MANLLTYVRERDDAANRGNGDRRIQASELRSDEQNAIQQYDQNQDGSLSLQEITTAANQTHPQNSGNRPTNTREFDQQALGIINQLERQNSRITARDIYISTSLNQNTFSEGRTYLEGTELLLSENGHVYSGTLANNTVVGNRHYSAGAQIILHENWRYLSAPEQFRTVLANADINGDQEIDPGEAYHAIQDYCQEHFSTCSNFLQYINGIHPIRSNLEIPRSQRSLRLNIAPGIRVAGYNLAYRTPDGSISTEDNRTSYGLTLDCTIDIYQFIFFRLQAEVLSYSSGEHARNGYFSASDREGSDSSGYTFISNEPGYVFRNNSLTVGTHVYLDGSTQYNSLNAHTSREHSISLEAGIALHTFSILRGVESYARSAITESQDITQFGATAAVYYNWVPSTEGPSNYPGTFPIPIRIGLGVSYFFERMEYFGSLAVPFQFNFNNN